MGIVNCEKHGESGIIPYVDRDIVSHVLSGKSISRKRVIAISLFIAIYGEEEEIGTYYILDVNFNKKGLKKKYTIRNEDDEAEFDCLIPKTNGVCGKCFDEIVT